MKKKLFFIIVLLVVCAANYSVAENHYIRAGASGDGSGSDWFNASPSIPSTLIRGDTYYVADGQYGGYVFNDGASGSTYIYIKKATVADHGTESGWYSSYGDGEATFTSWRFTTGYYDVNGQVGYGISGYGFAVRQAGSGDLKCIDIRAGNDYNAHHISIAYVDVEQTGEDQSGQRTDNFYIIGSSGNYVTDVIISHCYIHDTNRTHMACYWSHDVTIEYCVFARRHHIDSIHGCSIAINYSTLEADWIIRYCTFFDVQGTGCIEPKDSVQAGFEIYGNMFFYTNRGRYYYTNGVICDTGGDRTSNVKVFNNTFVETDAGIRVSGTGNEVYNNIWYDCSDVWFVSETDPIVHDYNWFYSSGSHSEANIEYGTSNPFHDLANKDFRLVSEIIGIPLNSTYSRDIDGYIRGQDGIWDKGAFEYNGAGYGVLPPQNLRIVSQ